MVTTPKAGLTLMPTNALKNESIFNEAMVILEAIAYGAVASRSYSAPPAESPSTPNGTMYLLPVGSPTTTGAWAGQEGKLAVYYDGWRFIPPAEGLTVWIVDESQSARYQGGVWVTVV